MKERVVYAFAHDGWEYQTIELPTLKRVQLWQRAPWSKQFEVGHSKPIPAGKSAHHVTRAMMLLMFGSISTEQYNDLVPDMEAN